MTTTPPDPNWHWDGSQWLWWNGSQWQAVPAAAPPPPPPAPPPPPPAPPTPPPPAPPTPPPPAPPAPPPPVEAPQPPPPAPPGYGPPSYGPPSYGSPPPQPVPPQPPKSGKGAWIALIVVGALILVAGVGGGAYLLAKRSGDGGGEAVTIQTEPISSATDPFTPPIPPAGDASTDTPVPAPVQTEKPVQVQGGKAGLYGGTLNKTQCDKPKLIEFLEANPEKGRVWAQVQGITQSDIRSYVTKLTSVILRSDTLVVNHGYVNGRATEWQAVLQAGTAVLVNEYGLPVVKCYCGNPLTAPPSDPGPAVYRGPTWPGWRPTSITVIQTNVTVIQTITLINIVNNQPFDRPTGTDGTKDTPTTLPSEPPTEPTPAPTGEYSTDQAYQQFMAAVDRCVSRMGSGSFNDLRRSPSKYTITTTPTGQGVGLFTVSITQKASGETYKFTVNVPAKTITPANEAAAGVGEICPDLDSG